MDLENPKSILIVQLGKMGDMILTTPLFSELKRLFPGATLKVLTRNISKDLVLSHDFVDEVIIYQKNILMNIYSLKSLRNKVDLLIDTKNNYSKTSAILVKFFKPKLSLGFNFKKAIYKISLNDYQQGGHAVDINLSPIRFFEENYAPPNLKPTLKIPLNIQENFEPIFKKISDQKILINISAGNESRYFKKEKWVDVINKINSTGSFSFTLMALEKDNHIKNYILKNTPKLAVIFLETKNIFEAAEIVRRNDIIVTADTSIVHVCSAFDKPVVALFPNVKWNLEKFAPLSSCKEIIISKNENSIDDINADEVVEGFLKLVEKVNSGNAESRTRVRKEDH